MSEIPDEDDLALRKRQAIQALMRNQSITLHERNRRMQEIMKGNFDNVDTSTPTPAAGSYATLGGNRRVTLSNRFSSG